MQIVIAQSDNAPGLEAIERTCFSSPWTAQQFRDSMASGNYTFLAAQQRDILGYMGYYTVDNQAFVTNIAVLPAHRAQGIAHSLIEHAKKQLAGKQLLLEVRMSNHAAIKLYEKTGFVPTGVRKSFYTAPTEDALLMEIKL